MKSNDGKIARNMVLKAVVSYNAGQMEAALDAFNGCMDSFQDSSDNDILGIVGSAMWEKIFVLRASRNTS